jgi:hypothetical protein
LYVERSSHCVHHGRCIVWWKVLVERRTCREGYAANRRQPEIAIEQRRRACFEQPADVRTVRGRKAAKLEERRPDGEEHAGPQRGRQGVEWHAVERAKRVAVVGNLRRIQVPVSVAVDVYAPLDQANQLHQIRDCLNYAASSTTGRMGIN